MSRKIRQNSFDRAFDIINYTVLGFVLIIFLYPLVFLLSASVSDPQEIWAGRVILFPLGLNFNGYIRLFRDNTIMNGYWNTIKYTLIGTPINLFMTLTAAYPLSRKDFKPRKLIMALYVFTMFFGGGLIPEYLLIKNLRLLNNFWVLILPTSLSVMNVIVTRTFFASSIPEELREAAVMDGCNNFFFLYKVVIPLSKAIIAVMTLRYAVMHWNTFFRALIYLSRQNLYPLQLVLRNLIIESQMAAEMISDIAATDADMLIKTAESIKYSAIIVSSIPLLILFPFIQKYFEKGVMVGSLKG